MDKSARSVEEFCSRNSICRATFYNLRKRGAGPRVMKVGNRTLITDHAETEWHRRMEAEADASSAVEATRTEAADAICRAASM
jgi:hypothetical protein